MGGYEVEGLNDSDDLIRFEVRNDSIVQTIESFGKTAEI